MITKSDKKLIIDAFKSVDMKKLELNSDVNLSKTDPIKVFRFGSYNGMQIAAEIIKMLPERKAREKATNEHKQSK